MTFFAKNIGLSPPRVRVGDTEVPFDLRKPLFSAFSAVSALRFFYGRRFAPALQLRACRFRCPCVRAQGVPCVPAVVAVCRRCRPGRRRCLVWVEVLIRSGSHTENRADSVFFRRLALSALLALWPCVLPCRAALLPGTAFRVSSIRRACARRA